MSALLFCLNSPPPYFHHHVFDLADAEQIKIAVAETTGLFARIKDLKRFSSGDFSLIVIEEMAYIRRVVCNLGPEVVSSLRILVFSLF